MAPFEHDSAEWTAGEAIVDVGVGAFARTVADHAKPPTKLSRYSTSLSRSEVLSHLHEVA